MARKYFTIERKDTATDYQLDRAMHRVIKAHQYEHGYASEFEALFSLLTSFSKQVKSPKEKEEREEKKIGLTRSDGRGGNRGGWSGAADFPESEAVRDE